MNKFEDALSIASKIKKDFDSLQKTVVEELGTTNNCSAIDVYDFLCSLVEDLEAATDGRPKPLDLSTDYSDSNLEALGYKSGTKLFDDTKSRGKYYKRWAECYSPGHEDIASVGSKDLNAVELKMLRDWIDDALKYHAQFQSNENQSA